MARISKRSGGGGVEEVYATIPEGYSLTGVELEELIGKLRAAESTVKQLLLKKRILIDSSGASSGGSSFSANSTARTFPVAPLAPERTINRQNALTNAVAYYKDDDVTPELIIEVARKFEAYTTGDLDLEEAKREMGIA